VKILYLDCKLGVAGDMLMASLLGLIDDKDHFITKMNELFPQAIINYQSVTRHNINGIKINIEIEGEMEICEDVAYDESSLSSQMLACIDNSEKIDILKFILALSLKVNVKEQALQIYHSLKMAENIVHNKKLTYIHNSKIGSLDAVIDIVGSCLLLEIIKPDKIISSPINVGSGKVKYNSKIFNVPAPATAQLVSGIPHFSGEINAELATPTGVVMIREVTDEFMQDFRDDDFLWHYGIGGKKFHIPTYTAACLVLRSN